MATVTTKKFDAPTKKSAADKPAKEKKAKAAVTGEPRKTNLFRLRNDAKSVWSDFKTQKAEIVAAFIKLGAVGAKAVGVTRGALIDALPKVPANNISFYLSQWQKSDPAIIDKLAPAE